MYSKTFGAFFEYLRYILGLIFLKMFSDKTNKNEDKGYAFQPFHFVKITPNSRAPFPRSGHRIAADTANFYSFGGYNPTLRDHNEYDESDDDHQQLLFREMWNYNFAARQWSKFRNKHTLPMELVSNAVVLHRNLLLVYGGTGQPFGRTCSNQLYVCKLNSINEPMVKVEVSGDLPLPQYGQAVILHDNYLYTIGGTTGHVFTCDVHRLNLKTMAWEKVYICEGVREDEPRGTYRHEVAFDGRYIYVLGGGTPDVAYGLESIPQFDIEKCVWSNRKTYPDAEKGYPYPRRCHGAVQINEGNCEKVFIVGGQGDFSLFRDLWCLDLSNFRWTSYPKCQLPREMFFHATAISPQGRLYVFGGNYDKYNSTRRAATIRRTNEIFSTWLRIPNLSEMCWEAVLHYWPHINVRNRDDLINAGLPRHFVQRLGFHLVDEV